MKVKEGNKTKKKGLTTKKNATSPKSFSRQGFKFGDIFIVSLLQMLKS